MERCEFHCHTKYSKDSLSTLEKILQTCQKKGIDRIAITDHDSIQGALEAYALNPKRVIIGQEITTTGGELLAYFVKEEIPPRLTPMEAIRLLQMQDAFIAVAHPFDILRKGHWELPVLLEIMPYLNAIEIFNARCMVPDANRMAKEFAQKHNLAGIVGSDAHILFEIGRATLELPAFEDKASLCNALSDSIPHIKPSGLWVHLFSRYAKLLKKSKNP